MLKRIGDWMDARTGHRALLNEALYERVLGGARWRYVFGSALVVLILLQAATGIALELYYSPSTTDAWASVNYIQTQVQMGALVRGLHHFGASAIVVLVVVHLLQTAWAGAFRAPREMNWLAGFVLFQIILALALTGYLLPWDQKGYWATQVATSIAGTLPLIGPQMQTFLQGGTSYGNLTLTRFHTLHVVLLPAGLFLFLGVHLALFRKHGVTPPDNLSKEELERRAEPFFPRQLLYDTAFAGAAVVVLFLLAWRLGAPLEAPADPSSQYLARPEWYFLPLFQLLKYFEGGAELVGTVILPGVAMGFLAGLPFLHAALTRKGPRVHQALALALTVGLLGVAGLGGLAMYEDANNPALASMAARSQEEAAEARRLAAMGVPTSGPLDLYRNDPMVWGRRVITAKCQTCHQTCDTQPYTGSPCLEGYASRAWIARFLRNPRAPHFYGNTKIDEMDAYTGPQESLDALTEFLYSQGKRTNVTEALAKKGEALFESEGCGGCHTLDGVGSGVAPDLKGWASPEWVAAFIRAPGAERFFGELNEMEPFDHSRLSEDELRVVTHWLHTQAAQPLKFP